MQDTIRWGRIPWLLNIIHITVLYHKKYRGVEASYDHTVRELPSQPYAALYALTNRSHSGGQM